MEDDVKELVIARLEHLPSHVKISIGSIGSFTKTELIQSVKDESDLGEKVAEIQISYMKAMIKR